MDDVITEDKVSRYFSITSDALDIVKESIVPGKEQEAKEIFEMVENYLSDAKHFEEKEDLVNAYAALNYSHGWLDCGVRLGVFEVTNDNLFTVR